MNNWEIGGTEISPLDDIYLDTRSRYFLNFGVFVSQVRVNHSTCVPPPLQLRPRPRKKLQTPVPQPRRKNSNETSPPKKMTNSPPAPQPNPLPTTTQAPSSSSSSSSKSYPQFRTALDNRVYVCLTYDELDILDAVARVKSPSAGAVVMFAGV